MDCDEYRCDVPECDYEIPEECERTSDITAKLDQCSRFASLSACAKEYYHCALDSATPSLCDEHECDICHGNSPADQHTSLLRGSKRT